MRGTAYVQSNLGLAKSGDGELVRVLSMQKFVEVTLYGMNMHGSDIHYDMSLTALSLDLAVAMCASRCWATNSLLLTRRAKPLWDACI